MTLLTVTGDAPRRGVLFQRLLTKTEGLVKLLQREMRTNAQVRISRLVLFLDIPLKRSWHRVVTSPSFYHRAIETSSPQRRRGAAFCSLTNSNELIADDAQWSVMGILGWFGAY